MIVSPLTADELIALLNKTSLPTVLVEGSSDFSIYRWIENSLDIDNIDILPCDGRSTLLTVYDRRAEIKSVVQTAYIADRDMWVFTSVPSQYQGIIWTDGYSIENDLYEPAANIDELLEVQEKAEHSQLLSELIRWFAFEVEQFRITGESNVGTHSSEVIQPEEHIICEQFRLRRGFQEPSPLTVQEVTDNYKLKIRGKNLFQLLVRFLSHKSRKAKHSNAALMEIALKLAGRNHRLERIMRQVVTTLQAA